LFPLNNPDLLIVGKVGSPFGIKGWLNIHSFTDPITNILNYTPWQLIFPQKQQTIEIIGKRSPHNNIHVQFAGCDDRTTASTFTGADIAIARELLPVLPKNEYYWLDLVGLTVINIQGETLGIIEQFFATGANDVFLVVGKKRHMLPYLLQQVVLNVDLNKKIMTVDWDPEF
jgi:16S rRNA processing protein RimM